MIEFCYIKMNLPPAASHLPFWKIKGIEFAEKFL